MQEQKQKQLNTIWAFLLGIIWPGASLLCVGKERQAVIVGLILVFYVFFLSYMPVRYIILSLFLFLIVYVVCLLYGLIAGLLAARKERKDYPVQEIGSELFFFLFFMVLTIFLFIRTPVSFYKTKQDFENVQANDILVIQEKVPLVGHHYNDSIIFYTDSFKECFGVVKAIAGDVLEFENETLYRNGKELAKIAHFPIKKFIVPENLLLILHEKEKSMQVKEDEQFETNDTKTLTFLTAHRIKGKALFILYSSSPKKIGKRLVYATVAQEEQDEDLSE